MKERLLTLALACGALAAFYALLAPKPAPPQEHVTRPITTEPGSNGYLGLQRWLEAEHVRTLSLRERYGRLKELSGAASPAGNLLITTVPHLYPLRDSETAPLREWVASGNTLLIVAGLSDTPEWSMGEGADPQFMAHMNSMTGLRFEAAQPDEPAGERQGAAEVERQDADGARKADADPASRSEDRKATTAEMTAPFRRLDQPQEFELVPNGAHALLEGVGSVKALSDYPTTQWRAVSDSSSLILELARDPASGVPVLWLLPYGGGQIILSAYGSIFTNKLLGEHDNARLLANIVAASLGPHGQVIIDDAHQGLVAFYDPEAFFGDPRLHRSLWWLLGLWLVFVIGPQRLRATASQWNPVDITSFVRATGGFMARVLKPASAGRQLCANFFNEIRGRIGLAPDGAPVWDWLQAHAAVPARDLAQLQAMHEKLMRGRRIDVSKLQNLLVRIRATIN